MTLVMAALASPLGAPPQLPPLDVTMLLARHNHERCIVSPQARTMPALHWDARLARVAQDHANACVFTHNPRRRADFAGLGGTGLVGENIALGHVSVEVLVSLWTGEKRDFVFGPITEKGAKRTGHYTQMISAVTTSVGCAMTLCREGAFLVCDYAPAGNILTRSPYVVGRPAAPTAACVTSAAGR